MSHHYDRVCKNINRVSMKNYVINLASRPDRLEKSMKQLKDIGIDAERFEAYTGDNRCLAFNKSQYHCIKKGIADSEAEGKKIFGVFEDDVAFTTKWPLLHRAMKDLPPKWLMLSLGCNLVGMGTTSWKMPDKESPYIARLHNAWMTHAIIWNVEMIKQVIEQFPYHTDEYEREGLVIFDEWLRVNAFPNYPCFVMNPMIAFQVPDKSDIWNTEGDYTACFNAGNEMLRQL